MTLQQLRVLVAVVEEGSFTRGAQAVYMTQSAASQHVRSLEQALGVVLLERTGSAVLPTSAGSGLVRYAREILRTAADAERFVGAMRQGRGGRLALGAGGSAVSLVPQLVAALRAAAPEVEVALRVAPRGDLEEGAARGTLDVAALSGPARRPGLETAPLCADTLVLVAAPGTALLPAAALAPVPLSRVAEQPLIAPPASSRSWRLVSRWAEGQGVVLRPSLRLVPVAPDVPLRRYELAYRAGRELQGPLAALLRVAPAYFRRRLPPGTNTGEGVPGAEEQIGAPGRVA
jgi:DNA-binding transcriptional LysR family regulator